MFIYKTSSLAKELVLQILLDSNLDFTPQLSERVDILQYAEKLSCYAAFILLEEDERVRGCLAYYMNTDEHFVYISFFWVSSLIQRTGWGQKLMDYLLSLAAQNFKEIKLEVEKNNNTAFSFYKKNGFHFVADRGYKLLLSKKINNESLVSR